MARGIPARHDHAPHAGLRKGHLERASGLLAQAMTQANLLPARALRHNPLACMQNNAPPPLQSADGEPDRPL